MIMIITTNFTTHDHYRFLTAVFLSFLSSCLDQWKMPAFPPNFWQAPSRCKRDCEPLVVHADYKWLQLWEYHGTYPLLN